jgi:hypothetical protein
MTIVERCNQLRQDIEGRNVLRKAHSEAAVYRIRSGELREISGTLRNEFARIAVLQKLHIPISKLPVTGTAERALGELRTAIVSNPSESGKDYQRFKRSLDKVAKDSGSAIDTALESVKRDIPSIDESFLKQVELVPGYAQRVEGIRRERSALQMGTDLRSKTASELEAFLNKRDELRRLADELDPNEFPKEVLEFFKAARRPGGAPLERLTDEVREWLGQRDQLKNVRVSVI